PFSHRGHWARGTACHGSRTGCTPPIARRAAPSARMAQGTGRPEGAGADALWGLGAQWPLQRFLICLVSFWGYAVNSDNRPLSPHLQIYGWQISMLTSTLHRISGIGLSLGGILLAIWLCAAASGPDAFAVANGIAGSWFGMILMFCWSLTL